MGIRSAGLLLAVAACGGDDGGTFTPVSDIPSALVNPVDVWSFGPTDAWFVDGSATIHRYDGAAWSTLSSPGPVSCIYAVSASDIYFCGFEEVVRYDGATFTVTGDLSTTGLDGLTSIWATGPSDIWVVGDDAIVARYNGTSWQRTIVGSPFKSAIWGSGPSDVYALSTFDLSHYDGSMWTEVEFEGVPAGGDGQVWGTSASDVWLMQGDDTVHHFDGSEWTPTELEIGDFSAVWGTGDRIWAAGTPGAIATFDGEWDSLAQQRIGAPYLQQMLAVHGSSASDVWVVGRQLGEGGSTGLIYHIGP